MRSVWVLALLLALECLAAACFRDAVDGTDNAADAHRTTVWRLELQADFGSAENRRPPAP